MYNQEDLKIKLLSELKSICAELGIEVDKGLTKKDIIQKILDHNPTSLPAETEVKMETNSEQSVVQRPEEVSPEELEANRPHRTRKRIHRTTAEPEFVAH